MQKIIKSNKKMKYTLLSIIFLILFMVTTISYPINTYAVTSGSGESSDNHGDTPAPGQKVNLDSYTSNEIDESANLTAGFLYYAASSDRCGVLFYVVDNDGHIVAKGVLLEKDEYNGFYADTVTKKMLGTWMSLGESTTPKIEYVEGISPVGYDDSTGWYDKGSASMNYLTSIMTTEAGEPMKIEIDGVKMLCPRWAYYVYQLEGGSEALEGLADPLCKWQVFMEPVSVNYLYTTNYFETEAENVAGNKHASEYPFSAGSPIPLGQWVDAEQTKYKPTVYMGTASRLLNESFEYVGDNRYTWKLYHTQLPFSLCLEHDEEIPSFTSAHTSCSRKVIKGVPDGSLTTLSNTADYNGMGIAIAALDISGLSLPPIHTFDTTTPGYPETPDPEKGTDGDCVITKLYYTEVLSSDGVPVETKDFHIYRMSNTTNYISIDEEEGYEIEAWRTSRRQMEKYCYCLRGTS